MTENRNNKGIQPVGYCDKCGKASFKSKKDAKKMARYHADAGLRPYRCGEWWHLGHLPQRVLSGDIPRSAIYRR